MMRAGLVFGGLVVILGFAALNNGLGALPLPNVAEDDGGDSLTEFYWQVNFPGCLKNGPYCNKSPSCLTCLQVQ